MFQRARSGRRRSGTDHVLLWAIGTTAVYLVWGAVRSQAFSELSPGSSGDVFLPKWLGAILALVAPAALNYAWGLALLPYAIPLADTPQVPHMRFFEELGQLLIFACGMGFLGVMLLRRAAIRRTDLSVAIALWFLAESVLSFGASYFYFPKDAVLLNDGIIRVVLLALFWLMIWLVDQRVRSWEEWHGLMMASCRAAALSVFVGLFGVGVMLALVLTHGVEYQWSRDTAWGLAYFNRFKGTFADPSQAAIYYAAALPLLLFLFGGPQRGRGAVTRTAGALAIGLSVGVVVLATGSRAGLVALAVSVTCVLLGPYRRYSWSLPVVGLAIFGGLTWAGWPLDWYLDVGVGDRDWSLFFQDEDRSYLRSVALETLRTFPVFGIGPGIDGKYGAAYDSAHNTLLSLGVEQGVLGVLVFVAFVGSVVARLVRTAIRDREEPRHAAAALLISLVAIMVGGQFHTTLKYPVLWFTLALSIALCRMSERNTRLSQIRQGRGKTLRSTVETG